MDNEIQDNIEETTASDAVDMELSEDDERDMLRARAEQLGIKLGPNARLETMRAKVNAALLSEPPKEKDESEMTEAERKMAVRERLKREKMRLVRVRISNLNPDKADLPGEIFTVVNKYLGTVRKYVPYGEATDNGYHIPVFILDQLKSRKFLQKKTKQNRGTGNIDVSTRWVSEFAIEELPPLTKKELDKLAASQAAAAGLDA